MLLNLRNSSIEGTQGPLKLTTKLLLLELKPQLPKMTQKSPRLAVILSSTPRAFSVKNSMLESPQKLLQQAAHAPGLPLV